MGWLAVWGLDLTVSLGTFSGICLPCNAVEKNRIHSLLLGTPFFWLNDRTRRLCLFVATGRLCIIDGPKAAFREKMVTRVTNGYANRVSCAMLAPATLVFGALRIRVRIPLPGQLSFLVGP
jgi:hypothetical protein